MKEQNQAFVIREFRNGDEFGMYEAHVKSIRELCAKDYSAKQIQAWVGPKTPERYLNSITENNERYWVIDAKGIIAGFSGWHGDQIRVFYMHPAYAGRGWGRQLFKATEEDFLKHSGLHSCVVISTITAKPFYERMGFKTIKLIKHQQNGMESNAWEMVKDYI